MSDAHDIRGLLRAADGGPLSAPDHGEIRRRGRWLVATRVTGIAACLAVLAGVIGIVAAQSPSVERGVPIIDQPGTNDPADRSTDPDDAVPTTDDTPPTPDNELDVPEPLGCAPPDLRPTYLPWLVDGEEIPEPTHVFAPQPVDPDAMDPPHGALVWAADHEAYDPDGYSNTDHVVVSSAARYEPDDSFPQVDLRGTTATLAWVGDPGIGELRLAWDEGGDDCSAVTVSLLIRDLPDYLGVPEPPDDRTNPESFAAWSADHEAAIEAEIVAIAGSLVLTDHSDVEPTPAACIDATDMRNTAPADPGSLQLYLTCVDDHDLPPGLYRHAATTSRTGEIEVDASALLLELFDGPPSDLADDGFGGVPANVAVELGPVGAPEPGRLVVYLVFPDGVAHLNASTAAITWHSMLAANLLQFPGLTSVELRTDGGCEAYSELFESEGCIVLGRDLVPWLEP